MHTECFSWFKTGVKVRLSIHIYLFLQNQTKPQKEKPDNDQNDFKQRAGKRVEEIWKGDLSECFFLYSFDFPTT